MDDRGGSCLIISAALEEAASNFQDTESQLEYLSCYDLEETGLSKVIRSCQEMLNLQTYYTVGPKEARAWNVSKGATAPKAAGQIHSDFERYFIRAETISFDEFQLYGGEKGARENGAMRSEGKEYVCQDGDVFHFLVGNGRAK